MKTPCGCLIIGAIVIIIGGLVTFLILLFSC